MIQMSNLRLGQARVVFGASIGNHHWSARPKLQRQIQKKAREIDKDGRRYKWPVLTDYEYDPKYMPAWIERELFCNDVIGDHGQPLARILCTPVFLGDGTDLYCIFEDPDTGEEYEVCYHTFGLLDQSRNLIMLDFQTGTTKKDCRVPLTIVFAHGIAIPPSTSVVRAG